MIFGQNKNKYFNCNAFKEFLVFVLSYFNAWSQKFILNLYHRSFIISDSVLSSQFYQLLSLLKRWGEGLGQGSGVGKIQPAEEIFQQNQLMFHVKCQFQVMVFQKCHPKDLNFFNGSGSKKLLTPGLGGIKNCSILQNIIYGQPLYQSI